MAITTANEIFVHELGDIFDAEHRFEKGQHDLLKHTTDTSLKEAIHMHAEQTKQQIDTLHKAFEILGLPSRGVQCQTAEALVSEGHDMLKEIEVPAVRDVAIASAAARIEHYEIASYRGLVAMTRAMGQEAVAGLLEKNLRQEEQTAQALERMLPLLLQKALHAQVDGAQRGATVETARDRVR